MLCLVLYCCEHTSAASLGISFAAGDIKDGAESNLYFVFCLPQFRVHIWRQLKKPVMENVKAEGSESLASRFCIVCPRHSGHLCYAGLVPGLQRCCILSEMPGTESCSSREQRYLTFSVFQVPPVHHFTHPSLAFSNFQCH